MSPDGSKTQRHRYWIHGTVAGRFLRLPLGTANKHAAGATVDHIERALSEGQTLPLAGTEKLLPPRSFAALAGVANYREPEPIAEMPVSTWQDLESAFRTKMKQRILLGKLAESTSERYEQTLRAFNAFLVESGVSDLPSMNRAFMERFKIWRLAKIQEKKLAGRTWARSRCGNPDIVFLPWLSSVN